MAPIINVDNTPKEDGRRSVKVQSSEIKQAQNDLDYQNSILQQSVNKYYSQSSEIEDNYSKLNASIKTLTDNIKKLNKDSQSDINGFLKIIGLSEKQLTSFSNEYDRTFQSFKKMTNEQNATGEQFVTTVKAMETMTDELGDLGGLIQKVNKNFKNLDDATKKRLQNEANELRSRRDEFRRSAETEIDKYMRNQKVANESVGKAIKEEIGKLGDNLSQLVNTLNINKIANQVAVSAKQQLQGELQTNYNISGKEFESFKKDLYGQIDTSIYSNEEVVAAMQTLNTTALGNTQTATKYFNDIIRGQKVLGISSEAQQQLLKLGNVTGRNELAFYQGTVVKFMNSSLGLNKQQLNELVQMNANLALQAADLGITSEEFNRANLVASAALERTEKGAGSRMTGAESFLLANTEASASLLGIDSGELSRRLNNGESFTDILRTSGAGAQQAMNAFRNGDTATITRMREYASNAWGADNSDIWSTLRVLSTQTDEFNKNYQTALQSTEQDLKKAWKEETDRQVESLNIIQREVNKIANFFDSKIPWTFAPLLTAIGVGVATIVNLMRVGGNIKEILAGLGKNGSVGLLGSSAGGKISGWLGASAGLGKLTNGVALGAGGGLIGGVIDSFIMQGSTGKGWALDALRGFGLGTGSLEKTNLQNAMSVGANSLKWGALGAGIGSIIPGVGTVVGGAIGALGGVIAGIWGTTKENKKLQEEQNEKLNSIETNTSKTAYNTAKDNIGIVYRYRGTDNYSSMGAIGSISGGSYSGHIANGPIGAMEDAGKPITSYWKQKRTYKDTKGVWHTDIHNGADFYVPEGTPLYSNATGTVTMNLTEKSGANIVGVTDAAGYTHLYAHMQSKSPLKVGTTINRGQFVGYSGKTGKVTGPHLHYTVLRPGEDARRNYWVLSNTVDPGPFVSSSIFNGDASSVISNANKASFTANGVATDILGKNSSIVKLESVGGISGPIVNSISDLKQTIIDLSNKTDRNEKILNMLTNKPIESPVV